MDMKKLVLYSLLSLVTVMGCIPDDRNNFMVDDSFGVTAKSLEPQASVHTGSYTLGVAKNGKGQVSATVRINRDADVVENALKEYNKAHGTSYKAVLGSLIDIGYQEITFKAEETVKDVTLRWDPDLLARFIGDDPSFVIPFLIESTDLDVHEGRNLVLIRLNRTGVALQPMQISRTVEQLDVEPDAEGDLPSLLEALNLDVNITNPIPGMALSFPVEMNTEGVPEGLLTLSQNQVEVAEGALGGRFRVILDKSKLLDAEGNLPEFPTYEIPVKVVAEGLQARLQGEPFDLRGLSFGNMEARITISWKETPKGVVITRQWGRYSTADASWSDFIAGFTANADRNVTMDDEYIYIAETNTTKNLWAISRTDPENYRKLPVGTVADEGIFYLACPRVVKNTNAAINSGKDVLMVSNMVEGDPKLYVYADGIDTDPSVMPLQTWAGRRLGDTWTWWGTLQEGVLLFKDFNSAQGTVTFPLLGKTTGNLYLTGRLVAPAVTGAGAYFPFPDNVGRGVASTRGGEKAWLVGTTANLLVQTGQIVPELTELSGYYKDTAFRFFELGDKRFIAYTRQVSGGDGRLFILQGEAGQSWEEMLQERNVVYHAAIQNDSEQDGLDETPSAKASGHSGMDLDVRVSGKDAYVVVLKQNVGLSLFRITNN